MAEWLDNKQSVFKIELIDDSTRSYTIKAYNPASNVYECLAFTDNGHSSYPERSGGGTYCGFDTMAEWLDDKQSVFKIELVDDATQSYAIKVYDFIKNVYTCLMFSNHSEYPTRADFGYASTPWCGFGTKDEWLDDMVSVWKLNLIHQ